MSSLSVRAQPLTHEWATHIRLIPARPGGLCAGLSPCRGVTPASPSWLHVPQEQLHAGTFLLALVTALLSHTAGTIRGAPGLSDEHTHKINSSSSKKTPQWSLPPWDGISHNEPSQKVPHRWDTAPGGSLLSQLTGKQVHVAAQAAEGCPIHQQPLLTEPLGSEEHLLHHTHTCDTCETLQSAPCCSLPRIYGKINKRAEAGSHPLCTVCAAPTQPCRSPGRMASPHTWLKDRRSCSQGSFPFLFSSTNKPHPSQLLVLFSQPREGYVPP